MLEIISSTVLVLPGERAGEDDANRISIVRANTTIEYWNIHRADMGRVVASGLVADYLKLKRMPYWLIQEVEQAQTPEQFIIGTAHMVLEKSWEIDEENPLFIVSSLEQFRDVQPLAEQAFGIELDTIRNIASPE